MEIGIMSESDCSPRFSARRVLARAAGAAAALLLPALALAQNEYVPAANLSLAPIVSQPATDSSDLSQPKAAETPKFLDAAAPAEEQPNIHGFFGSEFRTGYVTPRGLVVQDKGLVWQPILGLVIPLGDVGPVKGLTMVGGIWNSVDTYEAKANPFSGPWDEMDVFLSFSGTVAEKVSLNLTYGAWNSPEHAFHTEHNIDLKIGYDDSKLYGPSFPFTLNPYVDLWWAVAGDSTVILGRHGSTGYVEPGIVPTYTLKALPDYPLTFTLPMYVSVGPSRYWDAHNSFGHSCFGLFSIGLNCSVPLSFIPARYGHWHADAGVTYDYLINTALLVSGGLASGNDNRNVVIGSMGFGMSF